MLSQLHGLYASNGKITVVDPFGLILYNKIFVSCLKTQFQHLPEVNAEDRKHQSGKIPADSRIETGGLGN